MTSTVPPRGSLLFSARVLVVLLLLLPPFWLAVVFTPPGEPVVHLVRRWARRGLRWSGCRVEVSGLEHLDPEQCMLLVANHSSFLDAIVLLASVPVRFRFVANHLVATRPFIGLSVRKSGHLIVNRGSAASRAACGRAMIETLSSGMSLLVFPEGTRATSGLLPFQAGPFRVAVSTGRSVLPIAMTGTRELMPRRLRLLAPSPITVAILPRIAPADVGSALELRDRAATAISARL